jgi:tetratricopeptide (TPR) repeat protein
MPDDIKKKEEEKVEITLSPEIPKLLDEWTANPNSKIFVKLAEEYRKSGLIDEALDVCKKGLEANPNYLSGNMVLAKIQFDQGEYQAALDEALKVASMQSDNIMAQNLLLELYIKLGDKDNAIKTCDVISFLDPNNEGVLNKKRELETKGIVAEPVEEKVVDEDAKAEDIQSVVAEEFEGTPTAVPGAEELLEAEDEEPQGDFTTNTVAELYIKQGFYEKGLNIYKELLQESPDEPELIAKVNELEDIIANKEVSDEIDAISEEVEEEKEEKVYELDTTEIDDAETILADMGETEEASDEEFSFPDELDEELADAKTEGAEPESEYRAKKDKQIDKLSNWLGKIQSRGGR